MVTKMQLAQFPPGEPVFAGRAFDEKLFAEVDGMLDQGYCPSGWLDIETPDSRLTCLIHQGKPYLAGLVEPNGMSAVPLQEYPLRARQLEQAVCGLYAADLVRVLMMSIHFRSRPDLQAATNLVDLGHVLAVLAQEGHDAALALERSGKRTLMFLQKGIPTRLYFGDYRDDPGEGSVTDRFLEYGFAPAAPISRVEVFHSLRIPPDEDAGKTFVELDREAQPPPPVSIEIRLNKRLVLQRSFMPPCMFIGREPGCELRLDSLAISRRHARICWERGHFLVEDLGSSNGTLFNGQPVDRRELGPADEIVIGKFTIKMILPTATPAPQATMMMSTSAERRLYLVGRDTSLPIVDEVSIGKAEGVDVRVKGFGIKPIHVRLKNNGDGSIRLTCIGNAKVAVNGKKVQTAQMSADQAFSLGRSSFKVLDVPQYAEIQSG